MSQLIPLRAPVDDSGLPHKAPAALPQQSTGVTADPRQGDVMPLGHTVTITASEMDEIIARLQPHFPPYLRKIEPGPYGGLRFGFAPFTGREAEPSRPQSFWDDPQLTFVRQSENPVEHRLRRCAGQILDDLYEEAREQWKDAAYVADLKQVVGDAPDRWRAYERETKALESAYAYLRTPDAAREWPAALSRMVDAQDRTRTAAAAFDERAWEIARVHDKHLYADLGHDAALAQAGYPEAKDWHIASADEYGSTYYSSFNTHVPLTERTRRLIEQQNNHITKVGRLSGAFAD
ncbi:hypothetical protein QFZ22_000635 [Streptomyces canus]|uniref:Uncharacterized protein n=1 Tax=Streptomyces canus TaxID=58343 RepID=A0AAW8F5L1_9ACTN|nr:hypothetical protein [Streptomyces canus]MDQ0904650.1 hypothetical protein [Streptomyces canus]